MKPANIFLCRTGLDYDFVKVLDFGLVKNLLHTTPTDALLTQNGVFYGTPAYASPEAACGQQDKIDTRSDIYSLGCVAFWLLTGKEPFSGASPLAILMKQSTESPESMAQHAASPVPAALERLVFDCLAKNPAHRVQSASELMQRLEALQAVHPWTGEMALAATLRLGGHATPGAPVRSEARFLDPVTVEFESSPADGVLRHSSAHAARFAGS